MCCVQLYAYVTHEYNCTHTLHICYAFVCVTSVHSQSSPREGYRLWDSFEHQYTRGFVGEEYLVKISGNTFFLFLHKIHMLWAFLINTRIVCLWRNWENYPLPLMSPLVNIKIYNSNSVGLHWFSKMIGREQFQSDINTFDKSTEQESRNYFLHANF